jgi:hypothetical protein
MQKDCVIENLIWGTVFFAVIGGAVSAISGGPGSLTGKASRVKNHAQFKAAVAEEMAIQSRVLNESLKTKLSSLVSGNSKIKLSQTQQDKYFVLMGSNSDDAYNYLKSINGGLKDKTLKGFHTNSYNELNAVADDFALTYKNSYSTMRQNVSEKLGSNLKEAKDLRIAIETRLRNIQQTFDHTGVRLATTTSAVKGTQVVDDVVAMGANAGKLPKSMADMASVARSMDSALLNGTLKPMQVASLYQKSFQPVLTRMDDQIQALLRARLGAHGSKISSTVSREISEQYLSNLKLLNQNDDFFNKLIEQTSFAGAFKNPSRAAGTVSNLSASRVKIQDILQNQILKGNSRLSPRDVKKLRKELLTFHEKITAAASLKSGTNISIVEMLPAAVMALGLSSAVIYHISKQAVDIDNVKIWRSCKLASALAWDEWRPFQSRVDANHRAIKKIYDDIRENKSVIETLYKKYIYRYISDEFLNELAKKSTRDIDLDFTERLVLNLSDRLSKLDTLKNLIYNEWGATATGSTKGAPDAVESKRYHLYFSKWVPVLIKILVLNSNLDNRIIGLKKNVDYKGLNEIGKKKKYIQDNILIFEDADYDNLNNIWANCFDREVLKKGQLTAVIPAGEEDPDETSQSGGRVSPRKRNYGLLDLYRLAKKTAPNSATEEDIIKMAATSMAENTTGDTRAVFNSPVKHKDESYGLWQINLLNDNGYITNTIAIRAIGRELNNKEELLDPEINAKIAWQFWITRGLKPWSVTDPKKSGGRGYGRYKKYLSDLRNLLKRDIREKNMDANKIKKLVQEVISENYGKGYTPYPYHSHIGEEEEPGEDFIQDWKDFELSIVRDETRNLAIEVAKIFIKDLELFGDIIDLIGKNQSVATEILRQYRKKDENS